MCDESHEAGWREVEWFKSGMLKETASEMDRNALEASRRQEATMAREHDEARAAAARRIVLLRKLEWAHSTYGGSFCYICQEWRKDGHKDDCALAAELRLAEAEPLYVPSDTEERRVR